MTQKVENIAVVGGGQMGAGIAQVAAAKGFPVVVLERTASGEERCLSAVNKGLERLVLKEKIDGAERDAIMARITTTSELSELATADLVVEAVTEDLGIKRELFQKLDEVCKDDAILASNTSSISITRIAACTNRPDRVIGMHFMNPVPVMRLVELIHGLATSEETAERTRAICDTLGKQVVTSQDYPGFIVNRILMPMINEACYAVMEGVGEPEDIDIAMTLGTNQPMGPIALADFIGLDTVLAILEVLHDGLGDAKYRPCPLLRKYVDAGFVGRKCGRGFYSYDRK